MEIIFMLIISLLIIADYKLYKTLFTPFSLIAFVYLVLILLNNYIAISFGFYKVEEQSIAYILFFLILIYVISIISKFFFKINKNSTKNNTQNYIRNVILRQKRLIVFAFIIGLIAKYISLFQAISIYGFGNIKGKGFGIFAHIGNLGLILTPYLLIIFFYNRKLKYLILIMMMYINLMLFGGKYGIIIAILHLIILYSILYNINIKKTVKIGILIIAIGISTFVIVYAIIPSIDNNGLNNVELFDRITFSVKHFFSYLMGPIIATNYYFKSPGLGNIEILFTVLINIFKAVFRLGNYVNPVNPIFLPFHNDYTTNVAGLFAETVYEAGFFIASIYVMIFFLFVYYIFNMARYRGKMISLSALLLSIVMMMFFSNFLTVSGVMLQIIFLFIVELVIMKKIIFK